ncbi:MAG: hypothetical protein AAFQ66_15360 [Pseudomonadota bacterium]
MTQVLIVSENEETPLLSCCLGNQDHTRSYGTEIRPLDSERQARTREYTSFGGETHIFTGQIDLPGILLIAMGVSFLATLSAYAMGAGVLNCLAVYSASGSTFLASWAATCSIWPDRLFHQTDQSFTDCPS